MSWARAFGIVVLMVLAGVALLGALAAIEHYCGRTVFVAVLLGAAFLGMVAAVKHS